MPSLSDLANPFWLHPQGDPTVLPCTHVHQQHPNGDSVKVPCTHGFTQQHPAGDPVQIPCTHLVPQHPQGHPVQVPCTHGLVQAHPGGDRIGPVTVPCVHLSAKHPEGDTVTLPCTHLVQAHPGGDTQLLPCPHLVAKHPDGDTITVPCTHLVAQHPDGHPGPNVPCTHPMKIVRKAFSGRLVFYTDNKAIQDAAIAAVTTLQGFGIDPTKPRPLSIFNREPLHGDPNDNLDPMWSHYDPFLHCIQLTAGRADAANVGTMFHEMGHAILGHSIVNHYAFGPHGEKSVATDENGNPSTGLAMSEGWATFVGLVIATTAGIRNDRFKVSNYETMDIAPDPAIEYCVTCTLWDLVDTAAEPGPNPDSISLPFRELFRVYSPTLETLTSGPIVSSIGDFLDRIKRNNPRNRALAARIDEVRARNVG